MISFPRLLRGACVALAFVTSVLAAPRETLPLTEWRFQLAPGTDAWAAADFNDAAWETVTVPHTWNAFDGQDGGDDYHRGTGWYRTRFTLPASATGQRVLVEFDAASKVAEVFLDGRRVGSHTGAFARFRFDLTDLVRPGAAHVLAVRVDNSKSEIIPISGDFTQFGGLYRAARLLLTAPLHIATLDHASPGVFLTTDALTAELAEVSARVQLVNESATARTATLVVRVADADGREVATQHSPVSLAAGARLETSLPLRIAQPRRWDGVASPYVYRATVEVLEGDTVVDAVTQPLGLRTYRLDPERGFILNDRVVPLRGVNRHQDRPSKGWAINAADQREDMAIMRELGANAVRLAHYQHDQLFYQLCDEAGLAVWAELAFVNEGPTDPAARENAKQQLRELIRQNFNHPAIFFWSIGNETRGRKADGTLDQTVALLRDLAEICRAEDPARSSVYASDHPLDDPRNDLGDAIAFNRYYGWYGGNYLELGKFLDRFRAANPDRPIGLSEYGAGASLSQHEVNPPPRRSQAKGRWHPEEWQTTFHEESYRQVTERPWLWGTFIWVMFDFAADHRAEGDQYGRNDKGLVTYDRQTRKDAFYFYQAHWTTKPMVHLVGKRFWERNASPVELKAYSNAEEVELKLNGTSLGRVRSTDRRFIWPAVALAPGPNRLEAYAYTGGRIVAADWSGLTLRRDGDPQPNLPADELNPPSTPKAAPAAPAAPKPVTDIDAAKADDAKKRWERFQPEFDAFAAADKAAPPRPGEILFVGSSVFRRWTNVAEQMAPLPVLNRAFGGSRTGDQLARFEQLIPAYRPAVIVYYCGSNDLKAGDNPDVIFARYREFSDRVAKLLPDTHVVFVSSTRSPDRKDKFAAVDRFNELVRAHCTATPRRHFVDVNPALVDAQGSPLPGVYGKDDLHPEQPGYDRIAAVLKPALAEVWAAARR